MLICDCPRATHGHGSYATYVAHRCRCDECRRAARDMARRRKRDALYGRPRLVDAGPVRAHIEALQAAGMGWRRIAAAAGVPFGTMRALLFGAHTDDPSHPDHRPPSARILRANADRLLAVTVDLAPHTPLRGDVGARRRVQALTFAGWSIRKIAERTGVSRSRIQRLLHGADPTRQTADLIAAFFSIAWAGPPDGEVPAGSQTRARRWARSQGWLPALAWDDIDDPDEQPPVEVLRDKGQVPLAVRIADLEDLAAAGCGWSVLTVRRVGWDTLDTARKALRGAGRADLIDRLRAADRQAS